MAKDKTIDTMLRLPESLHRALKRLAEMNHRSLNGEMVHRLERSLLERT